MQSPTEKQLHQMRALRPLDSDLALVPSIGSPAEGTCGVTMAEVQTFKRQKVEHNAAAPAEVRLLSRSASAMRREDLL